MDNRPGAQQLVLADRRGQVLCLGTHRRQHGDLGKRESDQKDGGLRSRSLLNWAVQCGPRNHVTQSAGTTENGTYVTDENRRTAGT